MNRVVMMLLIYYCNVIYKSKGQGPSQSEETCQALDAMILGRSTLLLTSCIRDQPCTKISCIGVASTVTASVTIFPCTSPIHVHVFYSEGDMVNQNFTENGRASFSPTGSMIIRLRQTEHGIQFEMIFETTLAGFPFPTVMFPNTDIPIQCNTAVSTSIIANTTDEKGISRAVSTLPSPSVVLASTTDGSDNSAEVSSSTVGSITTEGDVLGGTTTVLGSSMEEDSESSSSMTLIIAIVSSVAFALLLTGAMVLALSIATYHLAKKMKQISTTTTGDENEYEYIQPPPIPAPRPLQPQLTNQTMEHEHSIPNIRLARNLAYNDEDDYSILEGNENRHAVNSPATRRPPHPQPMSQALANEHLTPSVILTRNVAYNNEEDNYSFLEDISAMQYDNRLENRHEMESPVDDDGYMQID